MDCYCGKTFYQPNALSNHQRYCKSSRNRLTSALSKTQKIWAKKREAHRLKHLQEAGEEHDPIPETSIPPDLPQTVPQNSSKPVPAIEPMPMVRSLCCC